MAVVRLKPAKYILKQEPVLTLNQQTIDIIKKNMINDLLNYMTDEQRKEIFEFIGKYYDLETGKKK